MTDWIRIEERLPEDHERVLIAGYAEPKYSSRSEMCAVAYFEEGKFLVNRCDGTGRFFEISAVHIKGWRSIGPLPMRDPAPRAKEE